MTDPTALQNQANFAFTKSLTDKNTLDIYIDKSVGDMTWYIRSFIFNIDYFVSVDFRLVNNERCADIRFYGVDSLDWYNPDAVGLAHPQQRHWKLYAENTHSKIEQQRTYLHEFLHSMGLEHPFDDRDGDYHFNTDPFTSATTDDTIMAYRVGAIPKWWYPRKADMDAITGLWSY